MKNKEDMEDEMGVEASEDCAQEETLEETEMEAADAEDDVFDFEASDTEENESFEEDEGLEGELSALGEGDGDDEAHAVSEEGVSEEELQGTELQEFESAEIEALEEEAQEYLDPEQVVSILESMLFATDRPQTLASLKQPFKGTNIKTKDVKEALEHLTAEYASEKRGVTLEEVTGGYQLRTKVDNMKYLKQVVKIRPFKLSGPALEVLSIVAYKQPCIKAQVDELRGVESGHIIRALMEKGLCAFAGKSDFPGKPMLYQTTRKFLEIFGLRNLKELPSLAEIDQLIPEGIGDEEKKTTLGDLTDKMSESLTASYSEGEEELEKITGQLGDISTTSDFFEDEKRRQKEKRDAERAQDIREALDVGENVEDKDRIWLERYEARLAKEAEEAQEAAEVAEESEVASAESSESEDAEDSSGLILESSLDEKGVDFKEPGEIGQEVSAVDFVDEENEKLSEDSTASELANLAAESFSDHFSEEGSEEALEGDAEVFFDEPQEEPHVEEMTIETYKPHSENEE